MKKIFAALTLILAFTINANAQEKTQALTAEKFQIKKELPSAEKGKKDAALLTEFLGLNATQNVDFFRLFEQKHKILEDQNLSEERRKEVARIIEGKIRASLDGYQIEKLEKNPELLKRLLN
jgi:hypothetical protein